MGRPTKLLDIGDDERDRLIDAIAKGAGREAAAALAGVHVATFLRWLAAGADPDAHRDYREFRDQVKDAEARCKANDELLITKHARTTWQAAAWRLERRYPMEYGRVIRTEVTGAGGGPVRVDDARVRRMMEDPDLARRAEDLYFDAAHPNGEG